MRNNTKHCVDCVFPTEKVGYDLIHRINPVFANKSTLERLEICRLCRDGLSNIKEPNAMSYAEGFDDGSLNAPEYWAGFEEGYRKVLEIIGRSATQEEALQRIKLLKASKKGLVVEPD